MSARRSLARLSRGGLAFAPGAHATRLALFVLSLGLAVPGMLPSALGVFARLGFVAMKNLAITLWIFQLIAALAMLVAAWIETESILGTGPALLAIGLLLGLATRTLQSPAVLAFALSGPLVCGLISFLISAFRWGPNEAHTPTLVVLATYMLSMAPLAIISGDRIWRWKTVTGRSPPGGFQFGLRTLLIAITACCLMIPAVTYVARNVRGESTLFGGFTIASVALSGLVLWRYLKFPAVAADDPPPPHAD